MLTRAPGSAATLPRTNYSATSRAAVTIVAPHYVPASSEPVQEPRGSEYLIIHRPGYRSFPPPFHPSSLTHAQSHERQAA